MGGGVTRVDTNDGTKLFDDESENDYYDIQCGMTGVCRRASWAMGGNAVEIWIVRRYNFL